MAASSLNGKANGGFTYLGVLLLIAVSSVALAATGTIWASAAQRDRERQLLWVGSQYAQALRSYYRASPGWPSTRKTWPTCCRTTVSRRPNGTFAGFTLTRSATATNGACCARSTAVSLASTAVRTPPFQAQWLQRRMERVRGDGALQRLAVRRRAGLYRKCTRCADECGPGRHAMKRLTALCLSLLLMAGVTTCAKAGAEDEMQGFIVDNTISHIGHDFYYYFADRLRATSRLDFNLVVRERPDARWGSLVTVEFEREVVYRRFLPPNTTELKDEAVAAADLVKQQIIQRKLQRLLQDTTDLERDEL